MSPAPTRVRVCDYIASRLHTLGVRRVYGIVGGGCGGLNDGIAKHGAIQWIGNHHEQASAFAAMGEAKLTGRLAVVMPTTGCGGTNCMTGVLDAWQDSTPVLFISGNVNRAQMTAYQNGAGRRVRKHGVQEADIVELVRPIVKYADIIHSPEEVAAKLEIAIHHALTGRRGPVWLDVPTDVQTALMDLPPLAASPGCPAPAAPATLEATEAAAALAAAKRPLILLGAGAWDAREAVGRFIDAHQIPFVCTYGAIDHLPGHPLAVGRVGVKGDRAGNFAMSTCDVLLVLGSSLTTPVTGYNLHHFAPHARVIVVDIEPAASRCTPQITDLHVQADIAAFLAAMGNLVSSTVGQTHRWVEKCREWRARWPVCQPEYATQPGGINLYTFTDALNRALPDRAVVVSDAGSAIYVPCQALNLRNGQRHVISLAQADMGFALPAAIGVALEGVPTVVITGDGSFQTNIQELATIRALRLPVKVIVWNNAGYLSIRATQNKLFEGRLMGTDADHGLWFPPLCGIAEVYDMTYHPMWEPSQLDRLGDILREPGAALIEVLCPPDQPIQPTIRARRAEDGTIAACGLEDMAPPLPPEEIAAELAAALAIT